VKDSAAQRTGGRRVTATAEGTSYFSPAAAAVLLDDIPPVDWPDAASPTATTCLSDPEREVLR